MANLEPRANEAVREAVDAFLGGVLSPDSEGETVFETRNSRYRLMDGTLFSAPDPALIGAELVGWLIESKRRSVVESSWQPGARAVLVDRKRRQNIIVTSTTQLRYLEDRGPQRHGSGVAQPGSGVTQARPPIADPTTPEPPSSKRAIPACPPLPQSIALPPARRAAPVHAPPRLIARPVVPVVLARPLPPPSPPPRREVAITQAPLHVPQAPTLPSGFPAMLGQLEPEEVEIDDRELQEDEGTDPAAPPFFAEAAPADALPSFDLDEDMDPRPASEAPFQLARAIPAPPPSEAPFLLKHRDDRRYAASRAAPR